MLGRLVYLAAVLLAYVRGTLYAVYFRLFRRNVRIALPFKAFAPVSINGPGAVSIGSGCSVLKNVFRGLAIVTLSPQARVTIGPRGHLGGLTIRCRGTVSIGERIMTAVTLVQDQWFLAAPDDATRGIAIGDNVWLGGQSLVLDGSAIASDCVVGAGACVSNAAIGAYSLISGNPVRQPLPIDRLLQLKGAK